MHVWQGLCHLTIRFPAKAGIQERVQSNLAPGLRLSLENRQELCGNCRYTTIVSPSLGQQPTSTGIIADRQVLDPCLRRGAERIGRRRNLGGCGIAKRASPL